MWMNRSYSAPGSKGSSSWCKELYFWHPALVCVCCRKQLFPCLAIPCGVPVMQQCSALLISTLWQHFKWLKERGEEHGPLIYVCINTPQCSMKTVCCLENTCCWSVGITLITNAVEWTQCTCKSTPAHQDQHPCSYVLVMVVISWDTSLHIYAYFAIL